MGAIMNVSEHVVVVLKVYTGWGADAASRLLSLSFSWPVAVKFVQHTHARRDSTVNVCNVEDTDMTLSTTCGGTRGNSNAGVLVMGF
jgi:hypothetical protein